MTWITERLSAFKAHFLLTDQQIAEGIGVSKYRAWKIRNEDGEAAKFSTALTGYLEALRAGKIREAEKMIAYYESFK